MPWMGGIGAETLATAVQPLVGELRVEPLASPSLWGRAVNDERYAVIGRCGKDLPLCR